MKKAAVDYQVKWYIGDEKLEDAYFLRREVFVKEQNVSPEIEYDGTDGGACHLVLYVNNQPVATGRFLFKNGLAHLGRIAVLPQWRGNHLGYDIVCLLVEKAEQYGLNKQDLNAQCHAQSFYERLGFVSYGDIFEEAGIPHIAMVRSKETASS